LAYILTRYEIRGRSTFRILATIPLILPPFVGAMSFIFLLGNAGTLNLILIDWLGIMRQPINFIYGAHGILFVETFHLYPLIFLNSAAALSKIDKSLEESSELLGATPLRRFATVTLRLMTPGYAAGAFLVFVWAFSDFGTPVVLRQYEYLGPQAYLSIVQFIDQRLLRMGLVMTVVMAAFALVSLILVRRYIAVREYASLTLPTPVEARPVKGLKNHLSMLFVVAVMFFSLLPHAGVTIASLGKAWMITPFPTEYTLEYFKKVTIDLPMYIQNSFVFCTIAVLINAGLGLLIAYVLARSKFPGKDIIDSLVTMILAVPGTVIGIAYLRAFHAPLPLIGISLTQGWGIMVAVLAVRRLPYVVRSVYATLLQVHVSLEEASLVLGGNKLRTFARITVPLVSRGLVAGSIISFTTAMQELSSTAFLYKPGWETMPLGIFIYYLTGGMAEASALGVLLIVIVAVSVGVANRLVGAKMGAAFGG
jgi:iron(III) transport system permease protein